eukprot:scaffold9.g3142.t1
MASLPAATRTAAHLGRRAAQSVSLHLTGGRGPSAAATLESAAALLASPRAASTQAERASGPGSHGEIDWMLRRHLAAIFGEEAGAAGASASMSPAASRSTGLPCPAVAPPTTPPPGASISLRNSTAACAARMTKRAAAAGEPLAPSTLSAALEPSSQSRMVVEALPPHRVVWSNDAWQHVVGPVREGHPALPQLQARAGNRAALRDLGRSMETQARGAASLVLRGPGELPLPAQLAVNPLAGPDGATSHLLLVLLEGA